MYRWSYISIFFNHAKNEEEARMDWNKRKSRPNDCTFMDRDALGFRTFEKQFDFVKWLNGVKK